MGIRFRLIRNEIKSNKHYGKYFAHTLKGTEMTLEEIEQQIQDNCTAKAGDVRLVMTELFATIRRALQNGQVVNLGDLGKLYVSVQSTPVDDPEKFRVDRHVTGFKCNYIPAGHRYQPHMGLLSHHVHRLLTDGCTAVHDKQATKDLLKG